MPRTRNQSLDALRGVAILLVLGSHFPYFRIWERVGWSGVYLFFVLSGFLVSGLLFDSYQKTGAVHVRRFIIRRGFKIWPSFYAYLFAVILLSVIAPNPPWRLFMNAGLFISNYASGGEYIPFTRHIWSLCVEEHFYLVLPLLFWICTRFMGRRGLSAIGWICLISIPACLGLRVAMVRYGSPGPYTHVLIDNLFCGVGLAYLYRFKKSAFRMLSSNWSPIVSAFLLIPIFVWDANSTFIWTVGLTCAALAFSLILAWAIDRWPTSEYASRPLSALARIGFYSYGIYLWHMVAQFAIGTSFGTGLAAFCTYLLVALILGIMMSQNTEQPFLKLRDRLFPQL
jgi:peptidoglycan/LPS O-acetylase OafA/YrhL